MVRSLSFSDSCEKTFQKTHYIKTLHHHRPYDSDTKRFGAPALSKDKRKAKERAFRTNIQQLLNNLFNNKLTRWQRPWIMDMPPKVVEQLLDAKSETLFLSHFCLLTDQVFRNFCTTVVWSMMMETCDVMFSVKYVYVSRRLMVIEPMRALNLLLVCDLIHNAEWRV